MATHISREIRESKESGVYDLKGMTQEQCDHFVQNTFKDALVLDKMVKVTLVVGAGKLARQKYDDNLGKWLCSALKEIGFEDDRGASATMECAGSFKFQHDTDKNEKFVHVFPRVNAPAEGENNADGSEEPARGPLSPEWLCVASEFETFKQMVQVKMPAWIEKRRCAAMLAEQVGRLEGAEIKLTKMEALDEMEQKLIDTVDRELIGKKTALLTESMKNMVENGKLTSAEKDQVLHQVQSKLEAIEAEIAQCEPGKEKKLEKLKQAKSQAEQRRDKIKQISPIKHGLANVQDIGATWRALAPMEKLLEKAGPKGRWSSKLTPQEAEKLGEKDDLDAKLAALLASARHWFEEQEEFDERVSETKKALLPAKKPIQKANPPNAPVDDGWSTVGNKKPSQGKKGASSGKASGSRFGAFGALAD